MRTLIARLLEPASKATAEMAWLPPPFARATVGIVFVSGCMLLTGSTRPEEAARVASGLLARVADGLVAT